MSVKNFAVAVTALFLLTLQGCVTITGEPREDMIVQDTEYEKATPDNAFYQSLSAGEMSGFSGTSILIWSFNTSPNLSQERAATVINSALEQANLFGQDGPYKINAEVLSDGSCGELFSGCDGNMYRITRRVSVKYTIEDSAGEYVASKLITTEGTKANFDTTLLKERRAAEIAYKRNLAELVAYLNETGINI